MAQPRQRWGWHQLTPKVAQQLVRDAHLPEGALVLDIGAGLGAITRPLIDAGCRVIAIELHPRRVEQLEVRFAGRATVVRVDAADLRLPRRPFHVVANPPYGITTAVLRRLLHPGSRLATAHLVLPDWAVQRWTAPKAPASQRWSQTFDVRPGRLIPRHAFRPPPKGSSQVLIIQRRR